MECLHVQWAVLYCTTPFAIYACLTQTRTYHACCVISFIGLVHDVFLALIQTPSVPVHAATLLVCDQVLAILQAPDLELLAFCALVDVADVI